MDYSNEEMKLGRLFGYAEALLEDSYYSNSFKRWIDKINGKIEDLIIRIDDEIINELMEMVGYCREQTINETTYILVGDRDFGEDLYGIVYLKGRKIEIISLSEFENIGGDYEITYDDVEFE